jgi:hypothetical protein
VYQSGLFSQITTKDNQTKTFHFLAGDLAQVREILDLKAIEKTGKGLMQRMPGKLRSLLDTMFLLCLSSLN